jgi:DNA-binding PadR family transcriptional regulator
MGGRHAVTSQRRLLLSSFDIDMRDQDFLRGFVKAYALWRCSQPDAYGLKMLDEARELRWRISPGTLYPLLGKLLKERDATVRRQLVEGKWRKVYRLSSKGRRELVEVRARLRMLARMLTGRKERRARDDRPTNYLTRRSRP